MIRHAAADVVAVADVVAAADGVAADGVATAVYHSTLLMTVIIVSCSRCFHTNHSLVLLV